jgi:hypothetical protein
LEQVKHVGPRAGTLKYDLLTALSVAGLHSSPTTQTSFMRLMALVTARYNWRVEEVTVGHIELARLWGVNDRTVKREMKRLMEMGVVICIRPGVRGRVGAYRLNYRRIYDMSQSVWAAVGPDFEDRMMEVSGAKTVVKVDFQPSQISAPKLVKGMPTGTWGAVRQRLKAEHPELFESWFAKLVQESITEHTLILRAPNGFVSRYIETHFATKLARAVDAEIPTCDGAPRQISLVSSPP